MTHTREQALRRMLAIIAEHPGIRPCDLNRLLGVAHSAPLRKTLLDRGLLRKERRGAAVHYFRTD